MVLVGSNICAFLLVKNLEGIHAGEMVDAIDSFVTYNYTTLMKLGSLYINGLCWIYVDDNSGWLDPSSTPKIIGLDGGMGKW